MNHLSNRVGIIGGGIAGLTLACTLLKEGIPAVIFEQSSEETSHGAAISLSQNALRLLAVSYTHLTLPTNREV